MSQVEVTRHGSTAHLKLNRPKVLNALSPDLLRELVVACEELRQDDAVHLVVLEGAGEHFSAGGDLPAFMEELKSAPNETPISGARPQQRSLRFLRLPWPLFAGSASEVE